MSRSWLWLALAIPFICWPLFAGLSRADIENDEAIYSFAVDRMLETGDWLSPRTTPNEDWPFLEKPPLKFWIVAAPIRFGLFRHDERAIRVWDAVFGVMALLYVFAIGYRLAGPFCGASAVLVLLAHRPLLFEHGLRSNNMEAPLVLAYCGGIWHFLTWLRAEATVARRHIWAICAYFYLGFMTKFVAIAFLPIVIGLPALLSGDGRRALVRDWRRWLTASLVTALVIAPWFVWASFTYGWFFWETILGVHVYARFTSYLDPSHLQPWHFYFTTLFLRFGESGQQWLVVAGLVTLVVLSAIRRSVEGWTIVAWAVVPVVAISLGSSKLYHYVYPFLPPLALGIGYLLALVLAVGVVPFRRWLGALEASLAARPRLARTTARPAVRRGLTLVAIGALAVAAFTIVFGSVRLDWQGLTLFKSSGLVRPLTVALLCGLLARRLSAGSQATAVIVVSSLLPVAGYRDSLSRIPLEKHPLRAARDCVLEVNRQHGQAGLYVDVPPDDLTHGVYYHFRRVRPWERAAAPDPAALGRVLGDTARPRPLLVLESTYQAFMREPDATHAVRRAPSPPLRTFPPNLVLLLPGPYARCVEADARPVGRP